jgi:hypothetical protein
MSSVHASGRRRNEILAELPALSDARFVCREPLYVGLLRRGLLALGAAGLACWALAAPAISAPLAALLLLVAGLAMIAAIRLRSGAVHFVGDCSGIFFAAAPGVRSATAQRWLFVPWSNISGIGVQLLLEESGSRKGVVLSLRVNAHEWRLFFARSVWRDAGAADGDSIRLAYPAALNSSYRLAATLRGLQSRCRWPVDGEPDLHGNETVITSA